MSRSDEMPAATEPSSNGLREHSAAVHTKEVLAAALSGEYQVHQGASLLYRIEIDSSGKASHDGRDAPRRGQYAFQTDILVTRAKTPLVVVELKAGSFSSHDVITYSWKAQRHKQVYPYLRYGFAVVGVEGLGRRFMTHNEGFDFAAAISGLDQVEADLLPIVQRQISNAERIIDLTRHGRMKLRRYEQTVEIEA